MNIPTPGPEHAQLARLAGTWLGEETMHPSSWTPQARQATSKITCDMLLDGFFLVSDYEQYSGDTVTFRGHGVYGWDPHKERFTMHWFDSMGMDPGAPALGTLEGNRLEFRNESPMGMHRYVYEFQDDGTYTFHMGVSNDGGETWQAQMDGKYRKA